ncbi:adaptin ear-binding coat-associated protein 1/2 [Paragonimus westermani]|uniref:Adaptin ear-binding coat-associated protein 1/2 n=1 Tax=Paragonimus westermani TaxID=34504 RepID=A0A5J4N8G5_9TREM|nr:adaptin ear-binding coat-associated protein 1/2 [Paragonimus westermani]
MDYENIILVKNEVYVYRIPPRQSNRGYRAADWGLDSPFWTGRLRAVAKDKDLTLKLEDRNTGELFAKCPVDAFPGIAVEPVLDSSRYFVIRLMADDGRTMFTGIGFAERSDSFDFNVAIQDHFKWVKQEKEVEETEEKLKTQPSLNLGFKEGEKIKLNLNTRRTGDEPTDGVAKNRPVARIGSTSTGLLPPPPAPSVTRTRGSRVAPTTSSTTYTGTSCSKGLLDSLAINPTSSAVVGENSSVSLLADIFDSAKPPERVQQPTMPAPLSWTDFQ